MVDMGVEGGEWMGRRGDGWGSRRLGEVREMGK
jgi:hypothetical protein